MSQPSGIISPYYIRLQRRLRITSVSSGIATVLVAFIVLAGWSSYLNTRLHIPISTTASNPLVAFGFLLSGIAVLLLVLRPANRSFLLFSIMVAIILMVAGLTRLLNLTGIRSIQTDLILFSRNTDDGTAPVRMSYIIAIGFILLSIAFLLKVSVLRKRELLQYILFLLFFLSFFSLIGIIYGIDHRDPAFLVFFKMDISTTFCFLLLSVSLLMGEYNSGVMAVITSNKTGGRMARLFLPFVLFFPLVIGLIDNLAEETGLFEDSLGLAIFSMLTMIVFFIIILRSAQSNNNIHNWLLQEIEERKKAEEESLRSNVFVNAIYENIPNMVFVKEGAELRYKSINKAGEELIGHTRQELLDKCDHDFFPKEEADFFRAKDKEVFASDKPVITEEQITTPEYGLRWLRTKKIAIRDESGSPLYMIGISEDITELKEKEEKLQRYSAGLEKEVKESTQELYASEERYQRMVERFRLAINSLGDNAWEYVFDTGISTFSDNIVNLLGYKAAEFTENKNLWWDITHPQDKWILEENDRKYKNGEINHHVNEYRVFHKDNSIKWILDRGVLIEKKPDGKPLRLVGIHMDITKRKEVENRVVENEMRFRDLTQNVPGVIYQWIERTDGTFGFTYVSPKLKDYFGIEPGQMHTLTDYIHPEDKEKWRLSIEESKANNTPWFFEGRLLYPDGRIIWWRCSSVVALKDENGVIYNGLLTDITERKLIEEKILKDQKRYEAIFNSQYQFMGLTTPDGILTEVNEAILDFAGVKAEEVIGKHCWECYWWSISSSAQKRLRESMMKAAEGEFIRYETDIIGKGGRIATIDFSIKPVFDHNNNIILLISEGRDITERKLLEQKSHEQEEQIRLFVKHTPAAVAMFDNHMRYMVASDRWYSDYGLQGQDIIGKSHYDIFPEIGKMQEWRDIHRRCLEGAVELREQDPFPRADGSTEWLRWEIHPWKTNYNRIGGLIMFTEMITERIKAREHLEKLNTKLVESNRELEQFAYVASHDLQEPLRMVSSFLQLLEKKYNSQLDEKAQQYIHFAVDGSERMKLLIDDLLKFSRVGTTVYEKAIIDCNEVVQNVIRIYQQNILAEGVVINVSRLPLINANKTQLEQLFQNLVGNAIKYRREEPLVIDIGCKADELWWIFHVKDNGIGIDNKFFDKVFVIFQRLHGRNDYSGTGIGLAICKKIVERNGGKIWVESEPDKGSVFYFSFPRN